MLKININSWTVTGPEQLASKFVVSKYSWVLNLEYHHTPCGLDSFIFTHNPHFFRTQMPKVLKFYIHQHRMSCLEISVISECTDKRCQNVTVPEKLQIGLKTGDTVAVRLKWTLHFWMSSTPLWVDTFRDSDYDIFHLFFITTLWCRRVFSFSWKCQHCLVLVYGEVIIGLDN